MRFARRSAEERLHVSLEEKEVLLREIHHRVKNNLQVVHSLLYLQANTLDERLDPVAMDASRQSRSWIKSMATIHDRLYRSGDLTATDFGDYLRALVPDLLRLYGTGAEVYPEIQAEENRRDIDTAIPCGLIVNELVANGLEPAFPEGRSGWIEIRLAERAGGLLELVVADDGIGFDPGEFWPDPKTLGLQLVHDQLDGEAVLETRAGTGARFTIRFPETRR